MSVSGIIFQWINPRVLDALSLWPRFAPEHPGAGAPARVPGQPALPDSSAASGPLCLPGPRGKAQGTLSPGLCVGFGAGTRSAASVSRAGRVSPGRL